MSRRTLLSAAGCLLLAQPRSMLSQASGVHFSVADFDRPRILRAADMEIAATDLSLVQAVAPGAQDRHRFVCDARVDASDASVTGFTAHADMLLRVTARVAALTAAWRLDHKPVYLSTALAQMYSWCVTPETRMVPTLEPQNPPTSNNEPDLRQNCLRFTNALAEFARASAFLCSSSECPQQTADAVRTWFTELLRWFTDSARAVVARENPQADSIFWTAQASELARFTRNDTVLRECGHRFRDRLLRQLHMDGYFAYALQNRRPYAESMFLLECLGSACESVSTPFESAWTYALPDGRSMRAAVAWAAPLLKSRGKWSYLADVRHFSEQPLRENAILFAGRAYNRPDYIELWQSLRADTTDTEMRREHPITQPALWAVRPPA